MEAFGNVRYSDKLAIPRALASSTSGELHKKGCQSLGSYFLCDYQCTVII